MRHIQYSLYTKNLFGYAKREDQRGVAFDPFWISLKSRVKILVESTLSFGKRKVYCSCECDKSGFSYRLKITNDRDNISVCERCKYLLLNNKYLQLTISSASVLSALLVQAYIPASVTLASFITNLRFLPSLVILILELMK